VTHFILDARIPPPQRALDRYHTLNFTACLTESWGKFPAVLIR